MAFNFVIINAEISKLADHHENIITIGGDLIIIMMELILINARIQ
jgi:hypothetical protein